jgi:Mg/Co/Ni transporter MgtE
LKELQKRLEAERVELTTVTQTVSLMQSEFDKNVIRFTSQKQDSVKRQAKLITALSPEAAVALLNEMSDDDAVRLFFAMKTDQVSPLIEAMSKAGSNGTKRAALLTERLSRVLPAEASNPRPNSTF